MSKHKIAVAGTGYVGLSISVLLAQHNQVTAVDIIPENVDMINNREIMETITMIKEQNLDVRTITMGISLIDCMDSDINKSCEKVYNKIYNYAKDLVNVGEKISKK